MYIDLDTAKKHLNIEPSFVDDDEYILHLIEVAEQAVLVHVNEDAETLVEKNGGCFPAPIQQAMLLAIGNWYQNREPIGNRAELPLSMRYLIDLYRNYYN
jgi:hypothetical protein